MKISCQILVWLKNFLDLKNNNMYSVPKTYIWNSHKNVSTKFVQKRSATWEITLQYIPAEP